MSVSIGIAVFPDHGLTAAAVLGAADDALYAAKAAGRDAFRVAQPPGAETAAAAPFAAGPSPAGQSPAGSVRPQTLRTRRPATAPRLAAALPPAPAAGTSPPTAPAQPPAAAAEPATVTAPVRKRGAAAASTAKQTGPETAAEPPAPPAQPDDGDTNLADAADLDSEESRILVAPGGAANNPPAPRQPRSR